MTQKMLVLRGIPASGKSTRTNEILAADPRAARYNNDDLSAMIRGALPSQFGVMPHKKLLEKLREQMIATLLQDKQITTLVIDNTHIHTRSVNVLRKLADQYGVQFEVEDFFDTPLEVAKERNALRANPVPDYVIENMHADISKTKRNYPSWSKPTFITRPQVIDNSLPDAVIFDLDGTLAHLNGRSPYDASDAVLNDIPDPLVVLLVQWFMDNTDLKVFVFSGREDLCQDATITWLFKRVFKPELELTQAFDAPTSLFMREAGDGRPDFVIKYELYEEHIRGKYNVRLAVDDRNMVVDLWRRRLRIPTWQVADGDF